ncbi:Crp/Fnr family transcriptional regulator [Ekhidna sp.]|uniref:Crp/Fnr family transcriptional regulator n=1 Tax=Ekhidna sp. TaxID=2608089 RepID=UPI0032999480
MNEIRQSLHFLSEDLLQKIEDTASIKDIPKNTEILREGQFVKVIPIVLSGLIKVFSRFKEKELLLYYIRPNEGCIMSFAASLKNNPSKIHAITEENTRVLLLPVDKVNGWIQQFPSINTLFYEQYNLRYSELLDTISHVIFDKLDQRLYNYLIEKSKLTKQNPIKISHRQIANELGTAREVISRVMKKLEIERKVQQHTNSIEIKEL